MSEATETAHRFAAYSDAVFAVIVTIMVLELEAPEAGELRIEVVWVPVAEEIRTQLEIPDADEVPLLHAAVALKPPQGGRRPDLPRTIELER